MGMELTEENHRKYSDPPTPPITPQSTGDDEKCLMPYRLRTKAKTKRWMDLEYVPLAILSVSLLQIIVHIFSTSRCQRYLRFESNRRHEIWRLITYMLVHDDWYHLILNVVIQCLFASLLEKRQGRLRVLLLYVLGGMTGVLGASCLYPIMVIGASAGVYALLISNIADIILNYSTVNYKTYRIVSIIILVIFDVVYNIIHGLAKKQPLISWEVHFVGGVSGLILGFVIYGSTSKDQRLSTLNRVLFWTDLILYFLIVTCFVIFAIQIMRCTPVEVIDYRYEYFC